MTLYDQLLPEILKEFAIGDKKNIEILRRMSSGFSGAEVYEIELAVPSKYTGKYYLKIDLKDEEFYNHSVSMEFSHAVTYVEAKEVGPYYVLLIALAGNSDIEFKSFWNSALSIRKEQSKNIISNGLKESVNLASFSPEKAPLSRICKRMLGDKVATGGAVETFLNTRLMKATDCFIQFQDKSFPNPLHFAQKPVNLQDCFYLPAKMHGDFHGDNIFLAQEKNDYAIIDWALARNDGILFFDDAYFELSLLIRTFEDYSLDQWIRIIESVCQNKWEDLEFENLAVIQNLHFQEDFWIKSVNSAQFSHTDKMRLGQYAARVVAGLNFAGKKNVSDTKREFAFFFSCVFLKKLFEEATYNDWTLLPIVRWNQTGETMEKDTMALASYCAHFTEEYQYILICGSLLPQQALTNEYLARIPWKGILSLSTRDDEPLKLKINEGKYLRHLPLIRKDANQEKVVRHGDVWWAFANGNASDPDTLVMSYPDWRNRYRRNILQVAEQICSTAPPQELMLLVACDSLNGQEDKQKIQGILECFDADESKNTSIAVLGTAQQSQISAEDFVNLRTEFFDVDLEALASYASAYLRGRRKDGIWLPHSSSRIGIQLEEDDEKYITSFLEIVGDHLLNPGIEDAKVRAFCWGEPITWDAIDRQLPVNRRKKDTLIKRIKKRVKDERWGRIELPHTPGAGASVLVRTVCWELRKEYPVVLIKKIDEGMYEGLKRIAKQTELPFLILLDGDYSYGDIETIETRLGADLANRKYLLLYTYRSYHSQGGETLGILDSKEAEDFQHKYVNIIDEYMGYSENEIEKRNKALQQLTISQSLAEFRLPFFYGMYAFQEDFVGVSHYIDEIIQKMGVDPKYRKIVSYLSLITYFTTSYGLSSKITKKLFSLSTATLREIREQLNSGIPAFVYIREAEFRICHPVIAFRILQKIYGNENGSLATVSFSGLCKEFIQDIRQLDGGETPSDYADELVTTIFIKRSQADRAEDAQDTSRNTFSAIVLMLENHNLQEEVFQCLTEHFSQNPHCFQHYGRLLSSHSPSDIDTAKQQFDRAIQIDPSNPIHYHARGIMYMRYCRNRIQSKELKTPELIYDQCKEPVERAIQDFMTTIDLARTNTIREDSAFNLAYPYSSILDICTMIVSYAKKRYRITYPGTSFWKSESKPSQWFRELLATAKRFDMNVNQDYPDVDRNTHYTLSRRDLKEIELTLPDLRKLIQAHPDDPHYKLLYLSNMDTRHDSLSSMNEADLKTVLNYCEAAIQSTGGDSGLLWKWFQIYIHMPTFSEAHALGVLESIQSLDTSITANYLLYILYFCRFYRTQDQIDAEKSRSYRNKCRELCSGVSGVHRRSCPFFLANNKPLPLTDNRELGIKLDCTLTEDVVQEQSAHMTLNLYRRFHVVFIPHHNRNLKIGQSLGTVVKATIGFGYNGLYGFDLELKQLDSQSN